jgi:hypothetical protein
VNYLSQIPTVRTALHQAAEELKRHLKQLKCPYYLPAGLAISFTTINKAYDQANNNKEAAAIAALFTEDAVFASDRGFVHGAIEKLYTDVFQGWNAKNHSTKNCLLGFCYIGRSRPNASSKRSTAFSSPLVFAIVCRILLAFPRYSGFRSTSSICKVSPGTVSCFNGTNVPVFA